MKDIKCINRLSILKQTGKFVDKLIKPRQELINFVYKEDWGI